MAAAGGFAEVVRLLLNVEETDAFARTDTEVLCAVVFCRHNHSRV